MKYVSVQPATNYFVWQLEIFEHSFTKLGYNLSDMIVIFLVNKKIPDSVIKYNNKNKEKKILFLSDERKDKSYSPSIQPYGLYRLFKKHNHFINGDNVFLHDSDIVFTKYFDWDSIVKNNKTIYGSDTINYIGSQYIESKSPILLKKMCEIVGITTKKVKSNNNNCIGAQYIIPSGFDPNIWKKIENDSIFLYDYLSNDGSKLKKENDPYAIQKWTASMWAILWNFWLSGYKTKIIEEMKFAWPSWSSELWNDVYIYHNSGVVDGNSGMFFKGKYIDKSPFDDDLSYVTKKNTCNWKYCELISEIKNNRMNIN